MNHGSIIAVFQRCHVIKLIFKYTANQVIADGKNNNLQMVARPRHSGWDIQHRVYD